MQILPRVLIVDDDPGLSRLTRLMLEQTGRFEVRVENQPLRALGVARDFRPDLVLMDVDMPGRSGGEVVREMRADPALQPPPRVLFFTALVSRKDTTVTSGGELYLCKPVDSDLLIHTVDLLLRPQPAGAAA